MASQTEPDDAGVSAPCDCCLPRLPRVVPQSKYSPKPRQEGRFRVEGGFNAPDQLGKLGTKDWVLLGHGLTQESPSTRQARPDPQMFSGLEGPACGLLTSWPSLGAGRLQEMLIMKTATTSAL